MLAALGLAFGAQEVAAQATPVADPPPAVTVVPALHDVTRLEAWSFFDPGEGGGNPRYGFAGNRATLSVDVSSRRFDVRGAFQYAQLVGLPRGAMGPGLLGAGAWYFDASRATEAYQLYLKTMSARVRPFGSWLSIDAGRMPFATGTESGGDAPADRLARERLAGRLVGGADWTMFERAFDGVRVDARASNVHVNGALLFPTQGAFEESANPTIGALRVAAASLSLASASRRADRSLASQLFGYHYRDRRPVAARPDNVGLSGGVVDIDVSTFGASHVHLETIGRGRLDVTLWGAGQMGRWYGQRHRAVSLLAESGYAWPTRGRPWVRVGVLYASGDREPADQTHGTFFPMLPTSRPSTFAGTFPQMNSREVFVEARFEPSARLEMAAAVRHLSLDRAADHWYSGTGATARRGTAFGFAARPSGGSRQLATLAEVSASYRLRPYWTLRGVVGAARGGRVVRHSFAGRRLAIVAIESVIDVVDWF